MKAKLHYVFSITMFLLVFSAFGQNLSWEKTESIKYAKHLEKFNLKASDVATYKFDIISLKQNLSSATSRTSTTKGSEPIINLPNLDGKFESFKIYEASVFSKSLAEKYPEIKSYVGISLDNPGTRLRMSISPEGIQTMVSSIDKPYVFMQPTEKYSNTYAVYNKEAKVKSAKAFACKTFNRFNNTAKSSASKIDEGGANTQELQTFRIAISTTAEYTNYHGGTISGALAGINATLSRVNEIFETDMSVTFELVDATELIYTDIFTDPYSDPELGANPENINNPSGWSIQLQENLTSTIGENAYDLGHLFGASGGGGNAKCIGCVCVDNQKGSAYTSPANSIPEGDTFDLDFVIHEIGHQMGAYHSWSFESEGTNMQVEPGSGSTIMGYAGITGIDNVQTNSDPYFHYQSIKQILDNIETKTCQTKTIIGNNPPNADAGNDYTIPQGTPYILRGSATDNDGDDNLTYCWEQIDSGIVNSNNFSSALTSGSTNRSLPPTASPVRYIPNLNNVLNGQLTESNPVIGSSWESISTVSRSLNWALTVRDRSTSSVQANGQSSYDTMTINVEDVPAFKVINPVSWVQGSNQEIQWIVGETNNTTINCQNVNILLSLDGGLTFPTTIATNTDNDGSYIYTVPNIPDSSQARILIEAADNIFYDVSDFNFTISTNPDFFMANEILTPLECNDEEAVYTFDFVAANGFSETTTFSASGNAIGSVISFSPTSSNISESITMTISNLENYSSTDYVITVTGTSNSITKNKDLNFSPNIICTSIANTEFNTSTTLVQFNTINEASGKPSGYSDTNISTNISRATSYDLLVNVNTDGEFTTQTRVWIDWNQDCIFDNTEEEYNLGNAINTSNGATNNSPLSIFVPSDAILGNTKMRVVTKYLDNGSPMPCENNFDGEVEDYILNISTNSNIEEFGFENLKIYPNPNNGEFTIQLSGSLNRPLNLEVFDSRGREVYNKIYFEPSNDFKEHITALKTLKSGLFFLKISDGVKTRVKKIVIY